MRNIVVLGLACGVGVLVACSKSDTTAPAGPHLTSGAAGGSGQGSTTTASGGNSNGSSGNGGGGTTGTGGKGAGGGTGGNGNAGGSNTSSGSGGNGGGGVPGQSCAGGLDCGGVSCCENAVVPSGTFPMGRSLNGFDAYAAGQTDELPEHSVVVAGFALDTFEVTVGRFRKFTAAFDGTPPAAGAGANPLIANSGWQAAWNASLAASQATLISSLSCSMDSQTWTDSAGPNEAMAMNCVSWFEAAAFCAWDGGRLPTEAEWEYAAAGGSDNRLYPWGADDPSANKALANDSVSDASPFIAVGAHPTGAGKWGHQDLAGGMYEWVLDWYDAAWYSGGGVNCSNCADINDGPYRVLRGGSWLTGTDVLRAAARVQDTPSNRSLNSGFRCARAK